MKVTTSKQKFLTKDQLVAGECYSLNGLLYMRALGEASGVVCLHTGAFTQMINISAESFVEVDAEIMVK